MNWNVLLLKLDAGRQLLPALEKAQSLAYATHLKSTGVALNNLGIFKRSEGDRVLLYFTPESAKLFGAAIWILGAVPCDAPTRFDPRHGDDTRDLG